MQETQQGNQARCAAFAPVHALEDRFERIDSRFSRIYLMFGITMVAVTIPVLQKLVG